MKKWKSLLAVAAIATLVFSMAACGDKDTVVDPTEAPTEAPADPTEAPADPTEAPAEPTEAPAPTEEVVEPTEAPAPTEEVVEPTEEPAPTEAPVVDEPTEAPVVDEPTEAPAPTEAPVATEAPAPTEAPKATATPVPTEAPKATATPVPTATPAPTATPEPTQAPVSDDLTINFAELTEGGYGYEATKENGVVNVFIATKYQEIQYVLPEVVDLAKYSTMIVDVVSDGQLDFKLVNPEAAANEWGNLAEFANNYTAENTPITEPVYIDLSAHASYDLSQINFMACADNVTFTIKNVTFVK